jgi:thiamine biosynthesis lipoprotein
MGVPVELILYAPSQQAANAAADAAFARIKELNGVMSDYDPTSELSRLSDSAGQNRAVRVSRDLWLVLKRAQDLSARTEGAFDITVGPYVKLWRRARRAKEFPSAERLEEARQAVGYQFLKLDDEHQTATLLRPKMRLDLGGIAMGYAVDEAMAVLKKHGITRALIDGSGDILVSDAPPGAKGWKIGIAPLDAKDGPPSKYVWLVNASISTSGDAWQYVELDGKRYSHIVDPHTGLGLTVSSSVTIIAPDCLTADSVATAVSVLGPEKGLKLVEDTPGLAAYIARLEGGKLRQYESQRLAPYLAD